MKVRADDDLPEQPRRLWRSVEPKGSYAVVIVGAGEHGLATASYCATVRRLTDVARDG